MFFLGHVGITTGIYQSINDEIPEPKHDLRLAVFYAILPDLIDKPLAILFPTFFGNHSRVIGHSLLAAFVVLAISLALARNRERIVYAWLAMLGHLVLDRIWIENLDALIWPLLGMPSAIEIMPLIRWKYAIFETPWSLGGEIFGGLILTMLVRRFQLYKIDKAKVFLKTGKLSEGQSSTLSDNARS